MTGRGLVAGLAMPRPLGESLPGDLPGGRARAMRLVGAFDDVLARRLRTLDNLPAYLDPALDAGRLPRLARRLGRRPADETWPIERRRALVAVAAQLYRMRGTSSGLAAHVRLFTAGDVEVVESGGSAWSMTPGAAAPGKPEFSLRVRVKPPAKVTVDPARLDALVAAAKPAHVVHSVEVVGR